MPLSDLERARESAARLAQRGKTARESAAVGAPSYARLQTERARVAEPVQALTPPPIAAFSLEHAGSPSWEVLLEWLRESTRAQAVFVVDADGLPVAQAGAIAAQAELDALGARLSFAFEQTARMRSTQGTLDSLFIELDGGWLSGIRLALPTGNLLFAVLAEAPLSVAVRDRLGGMLLEVLG